MSKKNIIITNKSKISSLFNIPNLDKVWIAGGFIEPDKYLMSLSSDLSERGNLGIEIASPAFAEPALMKMGGQACYTPQ